MKTERKKLSVAEIARETEAGIRELILERPMAWIAQARARLDSLPKTNFDLGCDFAEQGKWVDALFRFRVAAYFQPEYPQVWYNIGCCYYRMGKLPKAVEALRKALAQAPQHAEAAFTLAAIDPTALPEAALPERVPVEMVRGFFTSVAQNYDIEEARSKYQGGRAMFEFAKPLLNNPAPRILELGCGTGITARPWRGMAASITGVDCTPAMIAMADQARHEGKKLFDRLITADMAALPAEIAPASADLVLCVHAASYLGSLSSLMQSAGKTLVSGGLLALTVERHSAATGFALGGATGRFGHSPAYVKQVATEAGLRLVKETKLALYPEVMVEALVFAKS